jgi:hypothetical protein
MKRTWGKRLGTLDFLNMYLKCNGYNVRLNHVWCKWYCDYLWHSYCSSRLCRNLLCRNHWVHGSHQMKKIWLNLDNKILDKRKVNDLNKYFKILIYIVYSTTHIYLKFGTCSNLFAELIVFIFCICWLGIFHQVTASFD